MEEDDRATHHGQTLEMDQLMQNIRTCALTVEMPMHLKEMLSNVITLRASDWGRAASAASSTTSSVSMPARGAPVINADARGGVCYGPDGQILTAEERAFLGQSGIFHDDDDDDYEYAYCFFPFFFLAEVDLHDDDRLFLLFCLQPERRR